MFTSRYIRFFLPIAGVVAIVLWAGYRQIRATRMHELQQVEEKYVALLGEVLADDFQAVVSDLLVLAQDAELQRALEQTDAADYGRTAAAFERFAARKQVYDQIRFLDADGHEAVRINYRDGLAERVADNQLQAKQDRYYFQEAIQLNAGQVSVSAFDLNIEDGRIEMPPKPTIRFCTPVFDVKGTRRGILVLNYLGQVVLKRFARLDIDSPGDAMLLNANGFWLYDAVGQRSWAFMFPGQEQNVFQTSYSNVWRVLKSQLRGQVQSDAGLFTYSTVYPFRRDAFDTGPLNDGTPSIRDRRWYVVSLCTSDMIADQFSGLRQGIGFLSILLLGVVGAISWVLTRYSIDHETSERALRQSESRFRQMAEAIDEVFWMSTTERFDLLYVSPAFHQIWRSAENDLIGIGKVWRQSIHPDDVQLANDVFDSLADRDTYNIEYRIVDPSGAYRWIWDQGFAVRDEAGNVIRYAGIAEDITSTKNTQAQLLQSERLAAIGEAIAGLAHESRNALQRSQACLEMLERRVTDRPQAANLVARIQAALRDLHRLYDRVRDYASPLGMLRTRQDLPSIWNQACEDLAQEIQRRRAIVQSISNGSNGAQANGDYLADVDADAIRQVFRNILENALSDDLDPRTDREEITIDVGWENTTWRNAPAVRCLVRDNGPGFATGIQDRVFEPFFTTKTRGTGLGMAISRRIVEAHGGTIDARPAPEAGLEIEIVLPKANP